MLLGTLGTQLFQLGSLDATAVPTSWTRWTQTHPIKAVPRAQALAPWLR